MFRAINSQSGESITILDPRWKNALEHLRQLDRQDLLICQGCRHPVRIRAGEFRRHHFAHKYLQNCSYGHDSPALLSARAVLYEWLITKYGNNVTIERELDGPHHIVRPVDCWVESESGPIIYWIIDTRLKPQTRDDIRNELKQTGAKINWIFTVQMLREKENNPNQIHLTATERVFIKKTEYDKPYGSGGSLHYLDADKRILTTYRGIRLVHDPQLYEGHKESHVMSEVKVSP